MVISANSGESEHSYTGENRPVIGGSGSSDPKHLNPGSDDSGSDIEEVGSIRIVRRPGDFNTEQVGTSSGGDMSGEVTLASLPRKLRKVRRLQGATQLRKSNNPDSVVDKKKLNKLKSKYGIPPNVEIRLARPGEKADSPNEDWTCFYTCIFKYGFRFPISKFVKDVLVYNNIAPAQLMPNAWRVLLGMEVLSEMLDITFTIPEFVNWYCIVENHDDSGRYYFRSRQKLQIVHESPSSNKLWKNKYVFVRGFIEVGWDEKDQFCVPRSWGAPGNCFFSEFYICLQFF